MPLTRFRGTVDDSTASEHQIRNILVRDIMSAPVISVETNVQVKDVVKKMLSRNIGSLPVTDNGKIVGIVTRESLIQAL